MFLNKTPTIGYSCQLVTG